MEFLVLPFFKDPKSSYLYSRNFGVNNCFRIYTKFGELLPFICPVKRTDFRIEIIDYYGETVRSYPINSYLHKIIKYTGVNYLLFSGGPVQCLDLEPCDIPYRLKIDDYYSEYFWVGLEGMTKFSLSNHTSIEGIPYGLGFKQWFYLQLPITDFSAEVYQNIVKDEAGGSQVKYTKIYKKYELFLFNVPAWINNIFEALNALSEVKIVTQSEQVLELQQAETDVKSNRHENKFGVYDLVVNFTVSGPDSGACTETEFTVITDFTEVTNVTVDECLPINKVQKIEIDC